MKQPVSTFLLRLLYMAKTGGEECAWTAGLGARAANLQIISVSSPAEVSCSLSRIRYIGVYLPFERKSLIFLSWCRFILRFCFPVSSTQSISF